MADTNASNQSASNQSASNQSASNQSASNQSASNQSASSQSASSQSASSQSAIIELLSKYLPTIVQSEISNYIDRIHENIFSEFVEEQSKNIENRNINKININKIKEDFIKRIGIVYVTEKQTQCIARTCNGKQCSKIKLPDCDFCGVHKKCSAYGTIRDPMYITSKKYVSNIDNSQYDMFFTITLFQAQNKDIKQKKYLLKDTGDLYDYEKYCKVAHTNKPVYADVIMFKLNTFTNDDFVW